MATATLPFGVAEEVRGQRRFVRVAGFLVLATPFRHQGLKLRSGGTPSTVGCMPAQPIESARRGRPFPATSFAFWAAPSIAAVPRTWTAEKGSLFGMLIQLRIELAIPVAIGPAFRNGDLSCGGRLGPCDPAANNSCDKRGVSNPRTGSGTAACHKRGVAHVPAPLSSGDQRRLARGTRPARAGGDGAQQLARVQSLGASSTQPQLRVKGLLSVSNGPICRRQPPPLSRLLLRRQQFDNQGFQWMLPTTVLLVGIAHRPDC